MGRRPAGRDDFGNCQGGGGKLKAALIWALDNHEAWKAAKDKAEADGSEIPEELEPPEIIDGFGGWYEDFWQLSTERQIGFGIGPIPTSAIEKHVAGWAYDDAEMFETCMREMDGVYLMKSNKTEDSQTAAGSPRDAFRSATSNRRKG